jgi:hypothetical protein
LLVQKYLIIVCREERIQEKNSLQSKLFALEKDGYLDLLPVNISERVRPQESLHITVPCKSAACFERHGFLTQCLA